MIGDVLSLPNVIVNFLEDFLQREGGRDRERNKLCNRHNSDESSVSGYNTK